MKTFYEIESLLLVLLQEVGALWLSILGIIASFFLFVGLMFAMGLVFLCVLNYQVSHDSLLTTAVIERVVEDSKTDTLIVGGRKEVRTYPVDRIFFTYTVENGEELRGKMKMGSQKYKVGDQLSLMYSARNYHSFTPGDLKGGYRVHFLLAVCSFFLCFLIYKFNTFLATKVAPRIEGDGTSGDEEPPLPPGDRIFENL